jgi:5-methyltetrahydrofolate--homocysteine methyltransferase
MKKLLQDAIRERPLLGDGPLGTQLMIAGLEQGNCGEAWNLTIPKECSPSSAATWRLAPTA